MIRLATPNDYDAIWTIFQAVIQTEDTHVFPKDTPKESLEQHWFAPYMHTYVLEQAGDIVGTYIVKANQMGLGDHIANAGYMVHPQQQGNGFGKMLCEHSLHTAKTLGFLAMQFNIVVSKNKGAVGLWKKYGFEIIGTTPNGFRHAQLGLVDTYIMYRSLV